MPTPSENWTQSIIVPHLARPSTDSGERLEFVPGAASKLVVIKPTQSMGVAIFQQAQTWPPTSATDVISQLLSQIIDDRNRIAALENEMSELRTAVGLSESLRKITKIQAKNEIRKYFETHDGEIVYPSDISEILQLEYGIVTDLIKELEAEGKIAKSDKA